MSKKEKQPLRDLMTSTGEKLQGTPWNVYPRPRLRRQEWACLNGEWDFKIGSRDAELRKIRVPFCPESLLSGIHEVSSPGTPLFYFRSFSVPEAWEGRRILLHFGAVDQECDVKINGRDAGHFISGYLPFQLDITEYLVSGENLLEVIAVDPLDYARPWGKQKTDRGGMWYTPVSGIWQSVWIEPVPEKHIQDLAIDTDLTSVTIRLVGAETGTVRFQEAEYTIAKKQNQQSAEK